MGRHVTAVVSQNALRHNLEVVRQMAPNAKILAMVKANAYGHGLGLVAKTLADVDALGVASIEEALIIRNKGITTNIVLMEGIFRADELALVQQHQLTLVVHHWAQIQALRDHPYSGDHQFKVWLKINTGMNRLGFCEQEFAEAYNLLTSLKQVTFVGFMTHFSQADEKNNDETLRQAQYFAQIIGTRKGEKSLANSAGICAWPQTHADWIRPGLLLYGASPFNGSTGKELNLIPAMSLRSEIIAVRHLAPHDKVGYGGTWQNSQTKCTVGIVAMGYGDGYPWHAKNHTPVLIKGERAYTIGRVSMDMLAVDITHLGAVQVGDPVTLWGNGLPIEEVAQHAGTIPYELFCRFTERVSVHFVD